MLIINGNIKIPFELSTPCLTNLFFSLILSMTLISCATYSETQFSKNTLNWLNHTEKELIDSFGYPNLYHTSPEGLPVFEYSSQVQIIESQGFSHRWPFNFQGRSFVSTYECRVWFELKNHVITKITWAGNDCVAEDKQNKSS